MGSISVCELTDAVMGRRIAGRTETVFTGVSIDSRSVRKSDLFFAIVGKRLDGHDFLSEAAKKGAAGAVVSREHFPGSGVSLSSYAPAWVHRTVRDGDFVVVLVKDTTKALQNLAAWHRGRFDCPIAAVTGSNGKTTTKDLTWAILSRKSTTLRSEGSKNNHIGLPLTLLELNEETEAAVVELGTSGFGELRNLVCICSPNVGCITNVGPAHLEFFGSVENVARAKAELLEGMREGCPVVLNADDAWCEWLRGKAKGPVVTFGMHHPADFMAEDIRARDGAVSFRLVANLLGARADIRMPFAGAHNAYNAVAAAAIASQVGAGIPEMEEGLAEAKLPSMRYEISTVSGVTIINDAYNANPVSTKCALSSFCEMGVAGRRIFVCGDMLELGRYAHETHRQVGLFIKNKPIDYAITLGELAAIVGETAFGANTRGERWSECRSLEDAVFVLRNITAPGDAVLIKGSRANGMERIVDALKTTQTSSSAGGGKK